MIAAPILSPPKTIRVLIVEDNPDHAQLMKECLSFIEKFECHSVNSISSMWQEINVKNPDIILLDNYLPDGQGIDVVKELIAELPFTPIVMITALGNEQIAVQALKSGAADYWIKDEKYWETLPELVERTVTTYITKKALAFHNEQLRYQAMLLHNMRDAIIVWNTNGLITFWNPEAERLFKLTAKQVIGKLVTEVYATLFHPTINFPFEEKFHSREIERKVIRLSEDHWVSSRITPLIDADNNERILGYLDVIRDITQRKLLEERIQFTQMQLAQSTQLAAIADLADGIAHHINNPLSTIIAESQILRKQLSQNHPLYESASAIEKAGWRVQKAVQQLLDFGRPPLTSFQPLSVNETIENALKIIGDNIQAKQILIHTHLARNLPLIFGNQQKIIALWINLLILAQDGVMEVNQPEIDIISRSSNDKEIHVLIHDNGKIIPPEDLTQINATSFFKEMGGRGSGIEINICQEILRQHKGQLSIESDNQQGTTFRVSLLVEVIE
ncbi:MAG: response regulator [Anaerolineales bacterium]